MHRLYLLRHAEAAWTRPGTGDFDRPLTLRGREDAARLGRHMRMTGLVPTFVLCSSAARARESWHVLSGELAAADIETLHAPELYQGDTAECLALIAAIPTPGPLLVVGHNPTMQHLCHLLADSGTPEAMAAAGRGFAAGSLAVIEFTEPFSEIAPGKGRLSAFVPPGA
ncbi:SixA phosphatase family protein [Chelativorans sp. M5D2P16]|uniref:SixA phosphatase family protein n=1 Tax=Chelativorans sp. M5D2P16 TaxID=3095678 RepID=UPI002ACA5FDA|nr:histidine phosphatase family protein [Chelativorans sp. M5D2P16]MDZ5696988.1 histidine phosphatase family protein [Chelativorans sp. M5D2P16]